MFYFSRLRVSIVYMLIVFPSCFLIATTNAAFMCSSSQCILKKYYVILSQDPDRMQCLLLILWNWTELYSVWEHLSFVTYVSSFGSCLLSSLFHFSCPVCLCLCVLPPSVWSVLCPFSSQSVMSPSLFIPQLVKSNEELNLFLLLTYKVLNIHVPSHLKHLTVPYRPNRALPPQAGVYLWFLGF